MAVEEERPLVRVAVARKNDIDAVVLQDRIDVLAHLGELGIGVGVVRALAVRRVVPERDDPLLGGRREVVSEPGRHRCGRPGRSGS